ncbi:hypothetical protein [Deinococcus frigens]|uniref:hypothetical protein n=1 Tax=Deinococcus frigens TaxID=249403 RepID=UPI00068FA6D3|nr:hypothetical protein [Deinococcus frigens]
MSFRKGISRKALERGGVDVRPGDLGSDLEGELVSAVHLAGLPAPEREVELVEGRKWRSDLVWRAARVIFEVEGGTQSGKSRHSRGKGFADDCRKYNELTIRGWKVLRVTGEHISSGEAVAWIERALGHQP